MTTTTLDLTTLAADGGTGAATYFEINAAFDAVKALDKATVVKTARDMGIKRGLPTKAAALAAIKQRLYGPIDARSRTSF